MVVNLTEEKEALAYLKVVAASINFLNKKAQKEAYKRGLDVLSEIMALKKYASGQPVREMRDIARQEFLAGVQRYLIGFYEDSIYHSTLSVEIGLLTRLDEELSTKEKTDIYKRINSKDERPFSFTFGAIFNVCKGRNKKIIKNEKMEQLIDKIIDTRNTHIHSGNFTSASILSMKEIVPSEIEKGLKDLGTLEKKKSMKIIMKKSLPQFKNILSETRSTIDNLTSFEWCTKDKLRIQAQNEVNTVFTEQFAFINGIRDKQLTPEEKIRLGAQFRELIRDLSNDIYPKRKALETLRDSYEVLKGIGMFEEKLQTERTSLRKLRD